MPLLAGLFALTRLPNLTLAGLNYDEATYLYWGQVVGHDWSRRYIGAGWGGKQPLHTWLVALSELVLRDPVFAGRLVSVVAGALTVLAVWLLAEELFSRRVAIVAAVAYLLCPFTLIFDRLALIDSLLAAETLWLLYLSVRLIRRQDPLTVAGMALAFGAALLTKSVSQAFPLLLPAVLLAAGRARRDQQRVAPWLAATLAALVLGWVLYRIAFGAGQTALVSQFEQQYGRYTMSPSELLGLPWQRWGENAAAVARWFARLMTVPLAASALAALVATPWLGPGAWLLALWAVVPVLGQVLIAARFYDRYILFSIPPLLLLAARFSEWVYGHLAQWPPLAGRGMLGRPAAGLCGALCVAALLVAPVARDVRLLTDLETANQATGGYHGLRAMRTYLRERVAVNGVYLLVNYSPAPVEDGSAVLLRDVPGVKVLRVAPKDGKLTVFDAATGEVYPAEQLREYEVYYAFRDGAERDSWLAGRLELVQSFPNLRGDGSYVGLYRIRFDDTFR